MTTRTAMNFPVSEQNDNGGFFTRRPELRATLTPPRPDQVILQELVKVLSAAPSGLRRWSVMRAIREERNRASRPISLKFEAEVERVFRGACENWRDAKVEAERAGGPLFYRPEGKAGEVWAVHAERAAAWLNEETV